MASCAALCSALAVADFGLAPAALAPLMAPSESATVVSATTAIFLFVEIVIVYPFPFETVVDLFVSD